MTPEGRRAEAERLAGPHKEGSTFLANCKMIRVAYADCDCERLNRVTAIVTALEDAEAAVVREYQEASYALCGRCGVARERHPYESTYEMHPFEEKR
jgi:hypothetical protein